MSNWPQWHMYVMPLYHDMPTPTLQQYNSTATAHSSAVNLNPRTLPLLHHLYTVRPSLAVPSKPLGKGPTPSALQLPIMVSTAQPALLQSGKHQEQRMPTGPHTTSSFPMLQPAGTPFTRPCFVEHVCKNTLLIPVIFILLSSSLHVQVQLRPLSDKIVSPNAWSG